MIYNYSLPKVIVKFDKNFCRNLCLTHRKCTENQYNYRPNYRPNYWQRSGRNGPQRDQPYDRLFNWQSMAEFVKHLTENIVYFDGTLLAISKPWGVGIHKAVLNVTNNKAHLATALYSGSPKYCLSDAIDLLVQHLDVKQLKIVKTIDRFMSGIVLMATNEVTENKVTKALRRNIANQTPAMTFWCITKGYPIIDGPVCRERVGIKLLELDELGDVKHPIIIGAEALTNRMRRLKEPQSDGMVVKPALVELETLASNKQLGCSLVQLSTNVLKWSFIECYLAYKTSFVLGDNRFSRQVKHILGTPLSYKPNRMTFNQDMEPLSTDVCKRLGVRGNSYIPVQIHHKRLVLPLYNSIKHKSDLVIETNKIPDYFDWTLNQLNINRSEK